MVCNGQWFQFRISNEILSVCVCQQLWGGMRKAVNTHLAA